MAISKIDATGSWPARRCLVRDLKPGMALAVRYGSGRLIKIVEIKPDPRPYREDYVVVITDDKDGKGYSYHLDSDIGIDAYEGLEADDEPKYEITDDGPQER